MKLTGALVAVGAALGLAKIAGDAAIRRHESIDLSEAPKAGKTVAAAGLDIHYVEAGKGSPVVLIHGLGASTFSYRFTIPALAERFRVVALDLPGSGYSTLTTPDLSATAQVEHVAAFLDALGLDRVALVGHSMGGTIAQRFAATYPERVDRLVLIDAASDEQLRSGVRAGRVLGPFLPALLALVVSSPWLHRKWLSWAVYDPSHLTPEVVAGYGAPGRVRGHTAALRRWLIDRAKDLPYDPSAIGAPTLMVWGEADRLLRLGGRVAAERQIPNAERLVVARAGHWAPEEQPDVVNRAILAFLARPGGPRLTEPALSTDRRR